MKRTPALNLAETLGAGKLPYCLTSTRQFPLGAPCKSQGGISQFYLANEQVLCLLMLLGIICVLLMWLVSKIGAEIEEDMLEV
jgi:hypothetical protein